MAKKARDGENFPEHSRERPKYFRNFTRPLPITYFSDQSGKEQWTILYAVKALIAALKVQQLGRDAGGEKGIRNIQQQSDLWLIIRNNIWSFFTLPGTELLKPL